MWGKGGRVFRNMYKRQSQREVGSRVGSGDVWVGGMEMQTTVIEQ